MIEELRPYAEAYKENESTEALTKLYDYLDNNALHFNAYYNNPDGTGAVTAKYNFHGTFVNFEKSGNFPTPDLLKVTKDDGETVYVLFSALMDQ